jgi:lysophospholipase L1-like esterase
LADAGGAADLAVGTVTDGAGPDTFDARLKDAASTADVLVLKDGPGTAPPSSLDSAATGPARPAQYLADVSKALQAKWPANHTVNLVFHGHSVPSGYFRTPVVDTFNAYPHLTHVALKQRFPYAVMNAITTSIGGENSEAGARRFAKDVLTMRPDVVLIDYALNDRAIGLPRARAAWASMIQAAQVAGVPVLLLTPTADTTANLTDPNDPLNQHAEQIRRLAADYGVGLIDSLAAFVNYVKQGGVLTDLMAQSNHPNRQGHDLVAAEIAKWFP